MGGLIQDIYREDSLYCDQYCSLWSTNLDGPNKKGFEKFSDRFRRLFAGYHLDSTMHIRSNPETITLNLKELMRLFLSKDEELWKQHKWIFDGPCRYLDGALNSANKVALQSFPRSGNTFLRKFFELLTGVETGSDNTLMLSVML